MTYANTLELDANKSPTGQKVYSKEYGVCILATGDVADASQSIRREFGDDLPPITPHITLLQGQFSGDSLRTLREKLKTFTAEQAPFLIKMATHISKDGGGNTFWDVERTIPVWEHLNTINDQLCHMVPYPVGLMQQVTDSIEDGTGNKALIDKWGRDFNIPGSNRPHITVAYGSQNEGGINNVNTNFATKSFIADQIHLVKIDSSGNIIEILEAYQFLKNRQE